MLADPLWSFATAQTVPWDDRRPVVRWETEAVDKRRSAEKGGEPRAGPERQSSDTPPLGRDECNRLHGWHWNKFQTLIYLFTCIFIYFIYHSQKERCDWMVAKALAPSSTPAALALLS